MTHNAKQAHAILEEQMQQAGYGTARPVTVVTPRVWVGLDAYWGPADVPAEIA